MKYNTIILKIPYLTLRLISLEPSIDDRHHSPSPSESQNAAIPIIMPSVPASEEPRTPLSSGGARIKPSPTLIPLNIAAADNAEGAQY